MFDTLVIKPGKEAEINLIAQRISANKARYQALEKQTGVPWTFIGIIHYRESNCSFSRHLHNGDPLTARTVRVPKGRPATGNPPFTFEQSAIDAIKLKGLDAWRDWSVSGMLYQLESYNGFGYRTKGINSPYLWSYSQFYTKGLYVSDGVYDANAVSQQAGAAVILRKVLDVNNLYKAGSGLMLAVGLVAAVFFYPLMNNL